MTMLKYFKNDFYYFYGDFYFKNFLMTSESTYYDLEDFLEDNFDPSRKCKDNSTKELEDKLTEKLDYFIEQYFYSRKEAIRFAKESINNYLKDLKLAIVSNLLLLILLVVFWSDPTISLLCVFTLTMFPINFRNIKRAEPVLLISLYCVGSDKIHDKCLRVYRIYHNTLFASILAVILKIIYLFF